MLVVNASFSKHPTRLRIEMAFHVEREMRSRAALVSKNNCSSWRRGLKRRVRATKCSTSQQAMIRSTKDRDPLQLRDHDLRYSATQSICIDSGAVGH